MLSEEIDEVNFYLIMSDYDLLLAMQTFESVLTIITS